MAVVTIELDGNRFWSAVFGSEFDEHEWWVRVHYRNGADWNKIGKVTLGIVDPVNFGKIITRTIDLKDVERGLRTVIARGYGDPCTGRSNWLSLGYDSCEGDAIMQCAIFGEIVYG